MENSVSIEVALLKIIFLAVEIARNLEGVNDVFKAEFTADHTLNVQKELEEEHSETVIFIRFSSLVALIVNYYSDFDFKF